MEGKHFGSSGEYLDRFIQNRDSSVVNKFQKKYWKTKQTLIKVTGKKEDEHVVASDAELDAKLEVFHSIQRTCMELLKVIEQYQRRICFLSQEENELGRFLRSQGSQDKSRAGKIMQATGKALCFSSQQRLALRKPLCRLYQEIETFRYRAISDTWLTVNRMEQSRTEYRGALLWMKDVSQELDPDTHKQMEKFRKVQAQVRTTKSSFDKLKNDVCQKVDLLGASRCNLLSHVLTTYQTTLLHFWGKTSHTMAAIHESFKGCQHNEVSTAKDSTDKNMEKKISERETEERRNETTNEQLISLGHEEKSEKMREELDGEEDSLALLNEILGGLFVDDFSQEWTKGSGDTEASAGPSDTQQQENSFFLPSQLLDQNLNKSSASDWTGIVPQPDLSPGSGQNPLKPAVKETSGPSKDLSAWFNLFADLDPLSNPDAIGEANRENELHTA
ncbi:PREDICTED: islet cell autoantigen 1 [Poecilia mexicana]|uniref:islet cell autoantigen 1 n=1 Tax=Poecilia mexicana TaxID=48701 RepID=UPI00072E54AF|nr:PREDICTED: islet cell autoantigen 1 [Poecilia mexicana]XP_014860632.1 PREDICTED: islet cell autoantigen 1 [Poecilia mexicana]